MHREQMYGSGLPARGYNQELGLLASGLTGRVLDFGCGLGPLVAMLRERGTEAEGLEIDRPAIASALADEVRPYIRLYDGTFPAPFEAGSFDWVICSEVLEHIPDYRAAITEIARIARQGLILTVPDMSAVPMLHKHNVVPWHLLESTHVNFFTQRSLAATLQPHFTQLDFLRICRGIVNDTNYWTSLAVIARH
jgi:2-polyprenyl-3-methyl-5-hydroxy-6-metoxy-1,4-benzoquinol methylase